jgi:hypothetical protein
MGATIKGWLTLALALSVAACGRQEPAGGAGPESAAQTRAVAGNAEWDAFVAAYIEEYFAANPVFAVYAGRHEFAAISGRGSTAICSGWPRRNGRSAARTTT